MHVIQQCGFATYLLRGFSCNRWNLGKFTIKLYLADFHNEGVDPCTMGVVCVRVRARTVCKLLEDFNLFCVRSVSPTTSNYVTHTHTQREEGREKLHKS